MHYHGEVWVPKKPANKQEADQILEDLIGSYHEESNRSKGFYDFYQIGARYSGLHDSYDPSSNILNYKPCWLCNGSGKRPDMDCSHSRGCNGCGGTGVHLEWPTQFKFHEGDIMTVEEVEKRNPEITAYTLIIAPTGKRKRPQIFHMEQRNRKSHTFDSTEFDGKVFPYLKKLGIKDGCLITLDYHS
jgi:hypothetical protein